MVSLSHPKISFQHDNPGGFDKLLGKVNEHVSKEDQRQAESLTAEGPESKQRAFQVFVCPIAIE